MQTIGVLRMVTKPEFTEIMKKWLEKYLKKYSEEYSINIVCPNSSLSKIAIEDIKRVPDYASFEFKPDVLGILVNKTNKDVKLVFLNRSISAISLKEIGELICYSRLAKPIESFLVSTKGLPNEVNLLLLDKDNEKRILSFDSNFVKIFRFDTEKDSIDQKSIYPIQYKGKI